LCRVHQIRSEQDRGSPQCRGTPPDHVIMR
jgi:hypothetical protein